MILSLTVYTSFPSTSNLTIHGFDIDPGWISNILPIFPAKAPNKMYTKFPSFIFIPLIIFCDGTSYTIESCGFKSVESNKKFLPSFVVNWIFPPLTNFLFIILPTFIFSP